MKAAAPEYMRDMNQSAPGHRFGLYFPVWSDRWEIIKDKKTDATGKVLSLHPDDQKRMASLAARQQAQALHPDVIAHTEFAVSTSPFVTGMGYEHPLENGFAFLNPYGLPYLPGSSIKGVLRRAAEELECVAVVNKLFGSSAAEGSQGVLNFWDVFPQGKLALDIMTPHYGDYYQGKASPHDSGQPNPIVFLTVAPEAQFAFHVQLIRSIEIDMPDWQAVLGKCFDRAFDWLGFGAKTAVGYGAMMPDKKARNHAEVLRETILEKAKKAQDETVRMAQLEAMSPSQREIELLHRSEMRWDNNGSFLDDMEKYLSDHATIEPEVCEYLHGWMEKKYKGIMVNPDAVVGKRHKPKFKERPKNIAKALSAKGR